MGAGRDTTHPHGPPRPRAAAWWLSQNIWKNAVISVWRENKKCGHPRVSRPQGRAGLVSCRVSLSEQNNYGGECGHWTSHHCQHCTSRHPGHKWNYPGIFVLSIFIYIILSVIMMQYVTNRKMLYNSMDGDFLKVFRKNLFKTINYALFWLLIIYNRPQGHYATDIM